MQKLGHPIDVVSLCSCHFHS